jgi:O-antigen/teichoic acid export membrane protein
MAEIKTKSLKMNAILNMIKTLMGLAFPLITFPYASRILLPEGLGKVNFAISIISYFAMIASLGIETYGIREAAKIRDNKLLLSQFVKEIFIINMIATVVAYILLFISICIVPKFSEYRVLLYVTSATILFTTIGLNWLYTAVEDYFYITIRSVIFQLVSLVLLFTLVRTKEDYIKYSAISVISSVGSNLMNFIHSRKYVSLKTEIPLQLRKHIKPIFVLFAMAITVKVYTALDTTMIGFIKNDYEVGIYTAATKINKIVLSLVLAIGAVMLPRLSYYSKNDDKTDFFNLSYKGFDIVLLLSIPCAIGLSLLSNSVIQLLSGSGYEAAIIPMKIMNPIIIIIGLSNYIGIQMFMPLNKEKWTLYSVIAGALINFSLNCILIPKYGAMGASIATVCGESVVTFVQIVLLKKFISLKPIIKSFVKYFLNSLVMSIPVFVAVVFIESSWVQLIVGISTGVFTYGLLLTIEKDQFVWIFIQMIRKKILK